MYKLNSKDSKCFIGRMMLRLQTQRLEEMSASCLLSSDFARVDTSESPQSKNLIIQQFSTLALSFRDTVCATHLRFKGFLGQRFPISSTIHQNERTVLSNYTNGTPFKTLPQGPPF